MATSNVKKKSVKKVAAYEKKVKEKSETILVEVGSNDAELVIDAAKTSIIRYKGNIYNAITCVKKFGKLYFKLKNEILDDYEKVEKVEK